MKLRHLSNERLIVEFKRVVVRERAAIADVIAYVAELDRRGLHLDKACSSMTAFCVERMGYSQDAAANRVGVARVVQKYPIALDMLRRGDLTMTNIRTIAPVLTYANHKARLTAAIGKTKLQVQELVAAWAPKPDVPTRVSNVTPPAPPDLLLRMQAATASHVAQPSAPSSSVSSRDGLTSPEPARSNRPHDTPAPPQPSRPAPLPKPLSPARYKVEFTADKEEHELLMHARNILRHSIPDGDIKKILMKGLRELVAKTEARKFGKLKKPKPEATKAELPFDPAAPAEEAVTTSRTASREMKREMAERSGCQCEFYDDEGNRCSSKAWIEDDHMDGYAKVHETRGKRMRILCRAHNQGRNKGHDDLAHSGTSEPVQTGYAPSRSGTDAPVQTNITGGRPGTDAPVETCITQTRSGTNAPVQMDFAQTRPGTCESVAETASEVREPRPGYLPRNAFTRGATREAA